MQKFNPKVPILMYHEVSKDLHRINKCYKMTPFYYIHVADFERQMQLLAENGYKSLLFDDVLEIRDNGKYVILTFDDGLKGNSQYALPILEKYGFKGTFFVAVDSIGLKQFMTWEDLIELVRRGMSVQSHTISHRPLENLKYENLYKELYLSKRIIEDKLQTKVTALSFPHGSYNSNVVSTAQLVGYKYLCSSNVELTYYRSFQNSVTLVGRIAVIDKMSSCQLLKIIEYDFYEMFRLTLSKSTKNIIKKVLGIENYRKIYRYYFKIKG